MQSFHSAKKINAVLKNNGVISRENINNHEILPLFFAHRKLITIFL